ncbi:cysteine--tRNA ligase [Rubinisphaera margarita]|uniref:cysteine--tRNA ligase n=1 Tax=Rubinisphaera margarita TaxID=2909586 RepID=UPI001EE8C11B|nr:cysteine--tRNA ligase [Rubinisphaera margarita]MCG6157206.1 cysteine--tRNA ligase [Rubinisphaera margarita]
MAIRFYNSLNHQTEEFQPLEPGTVRMYSCGPTVYDFAHIGNFRSFLFADLIRRFLEVIGNDVIHVMNITDVGHMTDDQVADGGGEDKMEAAAKRLKEDKKSGRVPDGAIENPDDPYQVADFFTKAFLEDARKLGLKIAFEYPQRIPHATNNITEMQEMISQLIENGHAYVGTDGAVYYSVESFPKYGSLSGNTLEQLREGSGGRVQETDQAAKRHPADFLLWKPDQSHIMKWDSPWGTGYPGWHIECSVMARKLLGREVIDIHTGGEDLIFPHHECEIAQSCGASGKDYFARFWMHARFLMVEGEKMSKSKGNFYTVRDVLGGKVTGREVHPAVLRYELLRSHYGSNMNFTEKGLKDSATAVRKLNEFNKMLEAKTGGEAAEVDNSHPVLADFLNALSDNLNISGALGVLFPWMSGSHDNPQESLAVLRTINRILDVAPMEHAADLEEEGGGDDGFDVKALCKGIDDARASKDYAKADEIRNQLQDAGYEVRNSPEGTVATRQLA